MPIPAEHRTNKHTIRNYLHREAYPSSDIDIFLYGLTESQANKKVFIMGKGG